MLPSKAKKLFITENKTSIVCSLFLYLQCTAIYRLNIAEANIEKNVRIRLLHSHE